MRVLLYDDSVIGSMSEDELHDYVETTDTHSNFIYRKQPDPSNGWAAPFVTGHRYKVTWGFGLDFEEMRYVLSNRWENSDLEIELVMNFTDKRENVEFYSGGSMIDNETFLNDVRKTGDNWVLNDTETRLIYAVANGKDHERNVVEMVGIRCYGACLPSIEEVIVEDTARYWSDVNSWPSGALPVEGEDVEIESGWNMILDIDPPILNIVEINGRL
mmetsp:Transcript_29266/g.28405  ORF Transcript_29266/g.28405 Transcript_29266/m.28405 type:complete len:216 (-) Transcript_29266:2472-3119(-)